MYDAEKKVNLKSLQYIDLLAVMLFKDMYV